MLLQVIHDFEDVLSEMQWVDAIGLPLIAGPLLHIGRHHEPPERPLALGVRNLVEHAGGNEEDGVRKSHQLDVELGDEVPIVWIVHEARRPDRELAMHVSSVPATVAPEVSNTLHLSCEAEAVLAIHEIGLHIDNQQRGFVTVDDQRPLLF